MHIMLSKTFWMPIHSLLYLLFRLDKRGSEAAFQKNDCDLLSIDIHEDGKKKDAGQKDHWVYAKVFKDTW